MCVGDHIVVKDQSKVCSPEPRSIPREIRHGNSPAPLKL
jgi:hypothetical protein